MRLLLARSVSMLGLLGLALSSPLLNARSAACVPGLSLSHVATIVVALGKPLAPIPITGGVQLIEPITGGNITGSALNGTIQGGVAYPTLVSNQTVQDVTIVIYGVTDDGESFFVRESGVGASNSQVTRINLEAGGKYAYLANEYIVTTVMPNAARTAVNVEAYKAVPKC